jgi:hypothetical protein
VGKEQLRRCGPKLDVRDLARSAWVGREERVHDAAPALDPGPVLAEAADAGLLSTVPLREPALLARLRLHLVGGGLDLALEEGGAVGLGLDFPGEERPVGPAGALKPGVGQTRW